jgi:hypothetical protein
MKKPEVETAAVRYTTDPTHPGLRNTIDETPVAQAGVYLVAPQFPEEYRERKYVRSYQVVYRHRLCNGLTKINPLVASTLATYPKFYSLLYCAHCHKHRPVMEYLWLDESRVGT